jgi:hypothetical protein
MNATEKKTYNLLMLCGDLDGAAKVEADAKAGRARVRAERRAADARVRRAAERCERTISDLNNKSWSCGL